MDDNSGYPCFLETKKQDPQKLSPKKSHIEPHENPYYFRKPPCMQTGTNDFRYIYFLKMKFVGFHIYIVP